MRRRILAVIVLAAVFAGGVVVGQGRRTMTAGDRKVILSPVADSISIRVDGGATIEHGHPTNLTPFSVIVNDQKIISKSPTSPGAPIWLVYMMDGETRIHIAANAIP